HVNVRGHQIALELRNLVFEHQVIAEGVPGQFREQAVVLVAIVAGMGEHHIGSDPAPQALESLLEGVEGGRKVTIAEIEQFEIHFRGLPQKRACRRAALLGPGATGGKDGPYKAGARIALRPQSEGPTAADLNVIAVSADTQDRLGVRELQTVHSPASNDYSS